MKRNIIYTAFMISLLTMGGTLITSCEDIDPVQELNLSRVLSPTDLSVRIRNQVNIEASWGVVDDRTQSYTLELYEGTSAEGTPVVQQSGITSTTYTISSGTMGETTYLLRVKAVAEGTALAGRRGCRPYHTDTCRGFYSTGCDLQRHCRRRSQRICRHRRTDRTD